MYFNEEELNYFNEVEQQLKKEAEEAIRKNDARVRKFYYGKINLMTEGEIRRKEAKEEKDIFFILSRLNK